ncbi:XRE family transcriptional regulator [Pseudacidovorax sp. NFM-22]|uniref:XRE family transcriptional regulator n=1 Tax=Pseudacidovorax sp. NFM-22 TaxID=2744469 RepID=UPI001F32588C|nr:XRE family transcriptional regulator [Pseudacidovorax sp. NFM-22]
MTAGIRDLQPARLEQALSARNLTKGQLASLVGVSASTVTKWCKGDQSPEAETFERLASVLNLHPEWLTRPILKSITSPLYRKNSAALKAGLAKLRARTEWGQEVAALLSEHVDYPELNLPERSFTEPEQIRKSDIEAAAEECRELWQLGRAPIQDLMLAAEGAGIIVFREETEVAVVEGLSSWSAELEGRPLIHLAADKANGFRSRFDLAHEIGHLILHKRMEQKPEDKVRYKLMERQAHQFAGALLLPAQTFASDVRIPINLDNLLILKQRWGVSVGAMLMRLHFLGLLDDDEKLTLFKRRSARWGVKAEPGDDGWAPEKPRLLKRTVDLLVREGIVPLDRVSPFLGLSANDVVQLCGLDHTYFSNPAQVVELATLRTSRTAPSSAVESIASVRVAEILAFKRGRRG